MLVDECGVAKVLDFGLARAEALRAGEPVDDTSLVGASLTYAGAIMGTPLYMAPKQFDGDAVTAATDQFAFCVTIRGALPRTPVRRRASRRSRSSASRAAASSRTRRSARTD